MDLDWLIVGGGIHGVHMAARLLGDAGVQPKRLRIVDPGPRLLHRWRQNTATTGMSHLRSPSVHHLDVSPWSLERFSGTTIAEAPKLFASPYHRPALKLFNAHCDKVIESFNLNALHLRSRAVSCHVTERRAELELADGRILRAANVVLAIGNSDHRAWPRWAPKGTAKVHHIFDENVERWPEANETVAVVGGGISAVQVALRLAGEGHRVHLVARHPLRQHQFDSDPGWLGPRHMAGFAQERNVDQRRRLITSARHRGSVPPGTHRDLEDALSAGSVQLHRDHVRSLTTEGQHLSLGLVAAALCVDRVLLATGFESRRPGGAFIDNLIASASLPCACCGYPIVDEALRWHRRVRVMGPLAELELGPVSRNIAGAQRAGRRIVDSLRQKHRQRRRTLSPGHR